MTPHWIDDIRHRVDLKMGQIEREIAEQVARFPWEDVREERRAWLDQGAAPSSAQPRHFCRAIQEGITHLLMLVPGVQSSRVDLRLTMDCWTVRNRYSQPAEERVVRVGVSLFEDFDNDRLRGYTFRACHEAILGYLEAARNYWIGFFSWMEEPWAIEIIQVWRRQYLGDIYHPKTTSPDDRDHL